ncbi:MAG TPA: cupin domain-containing protein [Acidobacteriaceae bacterium]|jgi:quercetin dioxygenase-like cupin family protein|nr:cupin domain-containing protein [Acidobacteriaceae bacterium]
MSEAKAQHARWSDIPLEPMNPLLDRHFVHGEQAMLARILLRKGCIVPMHSHSNEQITYVLEGTLRFTLPDRVVDVAAGEVLVIPGGIPHQAEAMEDTIDLDVFTPPRRDWIERTDGYLRGEQK